MQRKSRRKSGAVKRKAVVGLDVGTTKICVIVGECTKEGVCVRAVSSHPSDGLRKGVVIDIDAAARAMKEAVSAAEREWGAPIKDVFVGIAGSHIKGFSSIGAAAVRDKVVTDVDVDRAIDSASAVYVPLDREILHVLPTDFILDGQGGIKDPVGMRGGRLEVRVYIVTGAVASVQNLLTCCERAALDVNDIVLQPIASAEATLTATDREMGIALVDIGGGTTDVAIYKDGWLRRSAVLGIGGNHFTNDISVGLKLPFAEAERLKKTAGSVRPQDLYDLAQVDVASIDGQTRSIPRRYVTEILQPRCDELLDLIKREIHEAYEQGVAVLGLVLTGGASLLAGFDRAAEALLAMPVRVGHPVLPVIGTLSEQRSGNPGAIGRSGTSLHELHSPMYATGVGLVLYGADSLRAGETELFTSSVFNRIVTQMTGWFKNMLGKR
ncbi:MAG: cell division protein FtsA [Chloroflexota bacterium]